MLDVMVKDSSIQAEGNFLSTTGETNTTATTHSDYFSKGKQSTQQRQIHVRLNRRELNAWYYTIQLLYAWLLEYQIQRRDSEVGKMQCEEF